MKKIFLIGMPGSGKSTLGKDLAMMLDLPFIDLDKEIELQEAKSILEIFDQFGENRFREIESQLLKDYCSQAGPFVMSTGGGAPCFHNNMGLMNAAGTTIYLKVTLPVLMERLKAGKHLRPLLKTLEPLNEGVEEMLNLRSSFYEKASHNILADKVSPVDLKTLLLKN